MRNNTLLRTQRPSFVCSCKAMAVLIVAIVMLGPVAGCSAPWQSENQPEATGSQAKMASSLTALFDQYLARKDLSTFERQVLERAKQNGKISAQDYQTAHDKEYSCLADKGYEVEMRKLPNGLYKYGAAKLHGEEVRDDAGEDTFFEEDDACAKGVSKVIESLYGIQQGNPGLLSDSYEAAVACLRKAGLVDAAYTGKKLENTLDNADKSASSFPFDVNSDAAQACFAGAGLAVAIE